MTRKAIQVSYWVIAGLAIASLSACSRHPCENYLKYPPKIPPIKLILPPKPVSLFQLREYYVCLLKSHGVQLIRLGQTWKIILPSDELFENDTADINPRYTPILNIVADFLRTYSKISVEVVSFSDHTPNEVKSKFGTTITQDVTMRQSDAVARYLSKRDTDTRLLYSIDGAGWDPVAWPGSAKGRFLNRRVEIRFRYYRDNTAWY